MAASITTGWLLGYIFEKKIILGAESSGAYKVNRIINENHPNEIPIFGSSRSESNYVPDLISDKIFNYGLSGAQDNVMLFFLEEEVKKNKTTPILINMDPEGLDYTIGDLSYYIYNADYPAVRTLLDSNYKWRYAIPFIKYYGNFEMYTKIYLNNKFNVTKINNKGGSFELNSFTPERFQALVVERILDTIIFNTDYVLAARFHHILVQHPERKFVIVFAPCHWSYFTSLGNINGLRAYIKELQRYKNVRLFNMSLMPYPDTYYLNTLHLNYEGAKVFSKQLRDSLVMNGIIK